MLNNYHKIIVAVILAALIVGAVLVLKPRKLEAGPVEFAIASGQSLSATARELAEHGLIYNRYFFVAYAVFVGHEKDFKAGRYLIPPAVSIQKLVSMFSSGQSEPEDIEVVIPEGTNAADINRILANAGLIQGEEFLKAAINSEGFLFPDTYRFRNCQPPTATCRLEPQDVVKKMRDNFEVKTADLFKHSQVSDISRVVVIASILEKEVKTEGDMRLVTGIIEKRLGIDTPLEIDATVAYGVCYPKFAAGRYCDASQADIVDNISVDSAYNTYRSKGLPAGPISNPGLKAIQAALNPQASDYLYYLTTKDGETIFSKTAAEHAKARQKYLKNQI